MTKLDATSLAALWIEGRPVALDENGPTNVMYDAAGAADFETIGGFEVIERAAHNNPDKVAIDDGTIRLTYAEFLDRVYGLAELLISNTTHNSVVASVVPNTAASPVVIMACALSGRVLVPLDAGHPLERNHAIFAESGAELVLLAWDDVGDLTFIPSTIKRIMVDPLVVTNSNRPHHGYDCDAPLFVSFTSGSTGRPKGLVSGGRYGGSALHHFIDMFHLNPSDVILGLASLSSGGARDAFAALGVGATIRLFDMRAEGFAGVLRVLDQDKISILSFVPSALRAILGVPGAEKAFRHLRVLDLHGERILTSDIALFRSKLPPTCHISITMGSLEAGAVFSWFVRDDKIEGPVAPVGYLMPDRRVTLLNEGGRPVGVGETGELFVRGSMAMGAWRGGHMETGPFIEDPEDSASSIYPMGDLVRQRSDGLFEYVGRSDRRLKVRGIWADLGEVEAAVRMIDGIEDVAVISASDNLGHEKISAFIAMKEGFTAPTLSAIRQVVAKETADQMAPTGLYVLNSIPRLANFKPDTVRLRAMTQH